MFQIGERIRCTSSGSHPEWLKEGKVYVVCGHNNSGNPLVLGEDGSRIDIAYGTFVKETPMSKYQEKKEQIESIKGWDKEADEILDELCERTNLRFWIENYKWGGCIVIVTHGKCLNFIAEDNGVGGTKYQTHFNFSNQCEKLNAFKQALLWLLDHSDIKKDEKEEKIKDLEYQRDTFATQVRSLNLQIEELRR